MESERNLMNTTEAARYLGVKPSYLYKMMMRRAVPYYKPGGKLCFFAKEDLDGRPRCLAETGKGKVAGRNRERGYGVSREPGEKQMIYPLIKQRQYE